MPQNVDRDWPPPSATNRRLHAGWRIYMPSLVLEVSTNALDVDAEAQVTSAISLLRGTRTIVTVTHLMSAIAGAHQVFGLANRELKDVASG